MAQSEWIDISVPFPVDKPMPYFPTDPQGPSITRIFDRTKGEPVTMSQININSHNGTHIDAPFHFMADGTTIDMMPLDTAIGPARVIEIKDPVSIKLNEVEPYDIKEGERILFKTGNSSHAYNTTDFITDYVYCTNEVAYYLKDKRIRLVGVDYVTIGSQKDLENIKIVHETLLGNDIYIIEMLNLDGVTPGNYEMICLPLRMEKGDAGPCRAIIRPMD
ncbi:MAG: cyclase family protein [Deltaproteobacteria bacterium]|nr:cyclase family protein [Deltaproteobacteria bacterium]